MCIFLIDNGINRNCGFPGLAVTNNQLSLSASNRDHAIHRFDSGLQRFFHRTSSNNAERLAFQRKEGISLDRPLSIQRLAKWCHHAPKHLFTRGHGCNTTRSLHGVAFFDMRGITKDHASDIVFFEIQRHTEHIAGEFHQLARHNFRETINACDAITDLQDGSDIIYIYFLFKTGKLLSQYCRYFIWSYF